MANVRVLAALAVLAGVPSAAGNLGIDVSQPVDETAAKCQKNGGVSFGVVRAWHSIDTFDPNSITTLKSWNDAGIQADVYLFPCSFVSPAAQIQHMLGNLTAAGAKFGRVWLDIESNADPACAWKADKAANCAYLQSLIAAGNATGVPFGVYSSIHEYTTLISDSAEGCPLAQPYADLPLWYPHYQSPPDPSFDDFTPFGGWKTPTIKQFFDSYTGTGIPNCGVGIDANWAPALPPME